MFRGNYILLFMLALANLLGSCKIEKRLHRPGYHVEWHKAKPSASKPLEKPKIYDLNNEALIASTGNDDLLWSESQPSLAQEAVIQEVELQNHRQDPDTSRGKCVSIFFRDGRRAYGVIVSMDRYTLAYERCDLINGPVFRTALSNVYSIDFRKTMTEAPAEIPPQPPVDTRDKTETNDEASTDKEMAPLKHPEEKSHNVPRAIEALFYVSLLAIGLTSITLPGFFALLPALGMLILTLILLIVTEDKSFWLNIVIVSAFLTVLALLFATGLLTTIVF